MFCRWKVIIEIVLDIINEILAELENSAWRASFTLHTKDDSQKEDVVPHKVIDKTNVFLVNFGERQVQETSADDAKLLSTEKGENCKKATAIIISFHC